MNFIIWLVVGGIIGWLASMVMRTDAQQGVLLNVVVGIVGAVLGGWLISPLIGAGTINQNDFSLSGLIVSLLGAVILLAIVNLFRRGRVR
ncbi:MAG: GlsB/YeaQ/YmgE family stress response membrane protein [Pseudomonadota bacterium]|nr:GlsB/YeaQ/YmgE family stress response membrane protein [Pseudomonadota bacterium]